VQCAVCNVQCAVCSVQCAVCSVQCAVGSVQCVVGSVLWVDMGAVWQGAREQGGAEKRCPKPVRAGQIKCSLEGHINTRTNGKLIYKIGCLPCSQ
jgi:hypothetical protein